ncbi:ArsR/SmtB family transcription factor [Mycobacterium sp. NPDC003449]
MDGVFRALADPSRRLLLDSLNDRDGQSLTELCSGLSMARQSVTKHLAVLAAAGLVSVTWQGRERRHHLDAGPIHLVADRWIDRYDHRRAAPGNARGEFVYITYIRTTPERLWHAVTNPESSNRHMGHAVESDWLRGSPYTWTQGGLRITDPGQVIVESDPYRRLAFTFHTFVPAIRTVDPGLDEEIIARAAAERRSRVSFELEPAQDQVKLTVLHDRLGPEGTVRELISQLWPRTLANLKSGLEQPNPPA